MIEVSPNNRTETKSDFFHETYWNLTPYLLLSKSIKVFHQWFSTTKFLSFMIKVSQNNGTETKSVILPWDIFKYHIFLSKMLKYFHDFQNQNFSVLWLKWIQIIEMKQNQTFYMVHIQLWHDFSLVAKH